MCLNEICSKICVDNYLPEIFPVEIGLHGGHVLTPFLFTFSLEHAMRKDENQVDLKLK
jgi:hypothetical protein